MGTELVFFRGNWMWEIQGAAYIRYMKLNIMSGKYHHGASRPDMVCAWLDEIMGSVD